MSKQKQCALYPRTEVRGLTARMITKIARKYFYVKCDNRVQEERFDLETFQYDENNYSNGGYTIYQSKESFE